MIMIWLTVNHFLAREFNPRRGTLRIADDDRPLRKPCLHFVVGRHLATTDLVHRFNMLQNILVQLQLNPT